MKYKMHLIAVSALVVVSLVCLAVTRPEIFTTYAQQIQEGKLYRERSKPEVYVIHSGKKIWISTEDALHHMGYDWPQVNIVADGALNAYPFVKIPSSSATPGSLVYPPDFKMKFPLKVVPGATTVYSKGREIQLVELYGWLRFAHNADEKCGDGSDLWFGLELDAEWALSKGIDLHQLLTVGSTAYVGHKYDGYTPRRGVTLPIIKIELDSWGRDASSWPKPRDWNYSATCGTNPDLIFPFNPYLTNSAGKKIEPRGIDWDKRGPYVRVAGSLVTDSPHDVQHRPGTFICRYLGLSVACDRDSFEWESTVPDWEPGKSGEDPTHVARWTEIHPPDLIEVLPDKQPSVTMRAVVLNARRGINACEEVKSFDLYPEAARPPNSVIAWEEIRAPYPATHFPWGENQDNGSWVYDRGDHIEIRAKVCGGNLFGGGNSPGRFKAFYRVWWKHKPVVTPTPTPKSLTPCQKECAKRKAECQDGGGRPQDCNNAYRLCIRTCPP